MRTVMKNQILLWIIVCFILLHANSFVLAKESDDIFVHGFELEKLLNLGSSLLATALLILILFAYKRNRNKRLLYVGAAFLLFAIKGFLISLEIWFGDWPWVDPASSFLYFAILLSFFFGIMKKLGF